MECIFDVWSRRLVQVVPELRELDQMERDNWANEEPPPYYHFGVVLIPFIKSILDDPDRAELLQRFFGQVAELAESGDPNVKDLIRNFIDNLIDDQGRI